MKRISENELEKRVDEVLFYIWDPIGIKDEPYARSEYHSYVMSVLGHVVHNKSEEEIADFLCKVESESMGLPANKKNALIAAKVLIEHKKAIDEGRS